MHYAAAVVRLIRVFRCQDALLLFILSSTCFADSNWIQHKDWSHASFQSEGMAEAYTFATNAARIFVSIRMSKADLCQTAKLFLEQGDGVPFFQRVLEVDVDGVRYTYSALEGQSVFDFADVYGSLLDKIKQGKSLTVQQDGMSYRFSLAGSARALWAIQNACKAFVDAGDKNELATDGHSPVVLLDTDPAKFAHNGVPLASHGGKELAASSWLSDPAPVLFLILGAGFLVGVFFYFVDRDFEQKKARDLNRIRREDEARCQKEQERAWEEQERARLLAEQERAREEQERARLLAEQERRKLADERRKKEDAEALRAAEKRAREIQRLEAERQRLLEEGRRDERAREAKKLADQAVTKSLAGLGLDGSASVEQVYEVFAEKKYALNPERVKVFGPKMQAAAEAKLRALEEAMTVLRTHGRA